jgi:hypothetical protein
VAEPTLRTTRVTAAQPATQPASSSTGSSGGWFGNLFSSDGTESSSSGGVLDRMSRLVGLKSDPAPEAPKRKASPSPKSTQTSVSANKTSAPADPKQNAGAIRAPSAKPDRQDANSEPEQRPASSAGLLNGAQPTVPTGAFDARWGAFQ